MSRLTSLKPISTILSISRATFVGEVASNVVPTGNSNRRRTGVESEMEEREVEVHEVEEREGEERKVEPLLLPKAGSEATGRLPE